MKGLFLLVFNFVGFCVFFLKEFLQSGNISSEPLKRKPQAFQYKILLLIQNNLLLSLI